VSYLKNNEKLLSQTEFLFSSEDITKEQAESFINDMIGKPSRILFNEKLYEKLNKSYTQFKVPIFAAFDSQKKLIFKTTIDSLFFYDVLISSLINKGYVRKEIANTRLSKLYGLRTLAKIDEYLFIVGWQQNDKIFIMNLKTEGLDSIDLNNDFIIGELLTNCGVGSINVKRLKKAFQDVNYPMKIVQFSTDIVANEKLLSGAINLFYVDPEHLNDTLFDPQWQSLLFTYEPNPRKLKFVKYKRWEQDSVNALVTDNYVLDYHYFGVLTDTLWLLGGEQKRPEYGEQRQSLNSYSLKKPFFYYSKTKGNQSAKYCGNYILYDYLIITTFGGKLMDEPNRFYPYILHYPYLAFQESPIILNYIDSSAIDLFGIKEIDWIFDFEIKQNAVSLLVQEKNIFILYLLSTDRSQKLISREVLGKVDSKGGVILDKGSVYYLDKNGKVISLVRE